MRRTAVFLGVTLLGASGCNNGGAAEGGLSARRASSSPPAEVSAGGFADQAPSYRLGYDSFTLVGDDGDSGAGGTGGVHDDPSHPPISTRCDDGIVGPDEECDDGDEDSDACTAACQTRDQAILPPAAGDAWPRRSHYLGLGRHPLAAGSHGFIVAFTDLTADSPNVSASIFDGHGQRQQTGLVSLGASPVQDANPVTAALPGGAYAIAWSDFDGDGSDLGIALRRIDSQHALLPLKFANEQREFSQRDADLIWDGNQLVAAWVDFSDANDGPDLRYRTFDAELNPTSGDLSLADSDLPEAAVALAAVEGGWAAAYREGSADGREHIVVKSGQHVTRVGPVLGGPISDRPALVELDETHLLVVFSEALAPNDGPANFTRLSYAVVDRTLTTTVASAALSPLDPLWAQSAPAAQVSPSAERGADGVYVSWASEARPGDAAGDQLWLKYLGWGATSPGNPASLRLGEVEMLLPRTCEESVGDQRIPALVRTPLAPYGGLAVAWEDYGNTQGAQSGQPEVVVHFAPTHPRGDAQANASYFEERWDGADGSAWNSHWSTEPTGVLSVTTQRNAGQVFTSSGPQAIAYVNDETALNVDLVSDVRFSARARGGFVTRRADSDPDTYLAFQFSTTRDEPWRTYAMLDGVRKDIQVLPPPNNVPARAAEVAYRARFRTTTQSDGSLLVAARVWDAGQPEPDSWPLFETLAADSVIAQRLAAPGRFGLLARPAVNRKTTFDDFGARFFDGAQLGDLDAVAATWPLPLKRGLAHYRRCTPDMPCVEAGGCCQSSADCAAGAACGSRLSVNQPLGSHADACVEDHCANGKRDADEERTDCGGLACAPCHCQVSASNGTAQFCPAGCPCGTADASCTQDNQCIAGLSCTTASGVKYGWPAGTGSCTPFHCANAALDFGETWPDCGGECGTCDIVQVTPTGGSIDAAAGSLQKILAPSPTELTSVTGLVEGQSLCLFTDSAQVTLDALPFNRVRDYTLMPGVPACFVVDGDLLLQSTNLPAETLTGLTDVANLDWQLSNEPAQFVLNGTNITRWLASVGGSVHDAAQTNATLWPMYSGGGALLGGTRYLTGGGAPSDWTFLHRPGTLFMVFRPDTAVTGYLLGTVHDSNSSVGNGFGIYFDASTTVPRLRFRIGNTSSEYVFAMTTTQSFPVGSKTVLAVSMSETKLEAFKVYDSIGSDINTGTLSTGAPYSVALVGAKASTNKNPFPGAIFEIDHYAGVMSQRARQAIVQHLLKKHGLDGPPAHCLNQALDAVLGETSVDCGGECGCTGACASACGLTTSTFDLSEDGSYYDVNLLRRRPDLVTPSASVTFTNDGVQWGGYPVSSTMDGDDYPFRWSTPTELDPDASATIVYDLGFETKLGAVRHRYGANWTLPTRHRIRIGSGSPVVWTEVAPLELVTTYDAVTPFGPVLGRYVELTMLGTPAALGNPRGIVDLAELMVFPAASQVPAPNTSQGYNLVQLAASTASVNSNLNGWYWTLNDEKFTGVRGKTVAEGATGDGVATLDLGGLYEVSQVSLIFHLSQLWEHGGKIELGVDGPTPGAITWTQALDTGLNVPLGAYPGIYPVTRQLARYVRLTNYFVAGQGTGLGQLDEIEVF
jgi:hypothetical protein